MAGENDAPAPTPVGPEERDPDEPAFDAPWQARAFGIAVALAGEDETLEWTDFQERLAAVIEEDESGGGARRDDHEDVYYRQWLAALEDLLLEMGVASEDDLLARVRQFEAGDRDASEFVIGDGGHGHGHAHEHDHDHEH